MKPTLPTLELQHRRPGNELPSIEQQMDELFRFERRVSPFSPLLAQWFLTSDKSKEDARLYKAFEAAGPTPAALAVLREKNKGVDDIRSISLWIDAAIRIWPPCSPHSASSGIARSASSVIAPV